MGITFPNKRQEIIGIFSPKRTKGGSIYLWLVGENKEGDFEVLP